jgi:hypothetical protein
MVPDKRETQPGYYLTGQVGAVYIQARPPAGSPTRRRGKKSLLIRRDATLRISGAAASGVSQDSTCICLPARSPALRDGGRGIFDQPEKNEFFNRLLTVDSGRTHFLCNFLFLEKRSALSRTRIRPRIFDPLLEYP